MKFLFRHKKQDEGQQPGRIAEGMQSAYRRVQGGWATWMARRTAGFSRRRWQVLLALFILGFGGYSLYLMVDGFTGKGDSIFSITPIRKPRHATETGNDRDNSPQVSGAEQQRIRRFRLYMDSLARSPAGKAEYDSIIAQRPGLMDSVRFIEKYYGQFKNR
jgi:hypothetical protein